MVILHVSLIETVLSPLDRHSFCFVTNGVLLLNGAKYNFNVGLFILAQMILGYFGEDN